MSGETGGGEVAPPNPIEVRWEQAFPTLTPTQIARLETHGKRMRTRRGGTGPASLPWATHAAAAPSASRRRWGRDRRASNWSTASYTSKLACSRVAVRPHFNHPQRGDQNVRIDTARRDSYRDQPDCRGRRTHRLDTRQGDLPEEHAREDLRDHDRHHLPHRLRDLSARRLRQAPCAGDHHAHRAGGRVRSGVHQAVRAAVALYRDG